MRPVCSTDTIKSEFSLLSYYNGLAICRSDAHFVGQDAGNSLATGCILSCESGTRSSVKINIKFRIIMKIVPAVKDDAFLIGDVVVTAIGEDVAVNFASDRSIQDVRRLFSNLAAREDSQYSYLNALKAIDEDGSPMGFIVAYDGGRLHDLRKAFFEEAREVLGREMEGRIADECVPGEYYLDSLAVFPQYRGRGVAHALISSMSAHAEASGKPLGLLCDKHNSRARSLYDSLGFRPVGETPFAGEMMDHLQMTTDN